LESAIQQVSRLKILFEYHDIIVIRTGLQANEGLDTGTGYVAGPYHPAFGELVDNEVYYLWFRNFIKAKVLQTADEITLLVHPSQLSKALGQKRQNVKRLEADFPSLKIFIKASGELTEKQIKGVWEYESYTADRMDFLKSFIESV
jgi:hypothetical protein